MHINIYEYASTIFKTCRVNLTRGPLSSEEEECVDRSWQKVNKILHLHNEVIANINSHEVSGKSVSKK